MTSLTTPLPETLGLSSAGLDRVDAALLDYIERGALAGAVTLVARHGQIVRVRALGKKDLASTEPMREDTIFRIFSMTKPVTGTAMMILHDEGRWHPDDPIAKHLPEFESVQVYAGTNADGEMQCVPPDHAPTLGELMTHTAGFSYGTRFVDPADPVGSLYKDTGIWNAVNLDAFVQQVARLPLAYQPGSNWRYSLSMDLQGAIIERLSGQSLPDFMHERIFAPLGMHDTAFHTPPEKRHRLATLYAQEGNSGLIVYPNPLTRSDWDHPPSMPLGGAGLVSTAHDYARYAQMLLNKGELDGKRIVSRAASEQQMTARLPDTMLRDGIKTGHYTLRPGFSYAYNGAVVTDPTLAGMPVGAGTYQWDGAADTWFWVDPSNDLVFIGLVQLLSFSAPPLQRITQELIADALIA
ncbi:serine hydrolase domain-containing protein [Paraburkholderia caffeinilytica]|uniref:serine hydrolase domain-containing protein n=1 Tax=Paraburkholderia caffeinilytica TaxID=1761016 RepID=UPI0038B89A34